MTDYTCSYPGCPCLVNINGGNITISGGNITFLSMTSFKCTDHNRHLEAGNGVAAARREAERQTAERNRIERENQQRETQRLANERARQAEIQRKREADLRAEQEKQRLEAVKQAASEAEIARQKKITEENLIAQKERNRILDEKKREIEKLLGDTKQTYVEVKEVLESKALSIKYTELITIVGPKGRGKTTFSWLRGDCPDRPKRTLSDGTVEVHRIGTMMDTIGINLETSSLLRLFATFAITGVPDTFVMCINDRIETPLAIINHLLISNPYIVMINPNSVHKIVGPEALVPPTFTADQMEVMYEMEAYELCRKEKIAAVPITHLDPIPLNHNLRSAFENIFPGSVVSLPPWEEIQKDRFAILRFQICKFVKELIENFEGDQLKFMNSIKE